MNEIHKKTINEKELETLTFWQDNQIFEKSIKSPAGAAPKGNFTFYDGPPFATGVPHHGHILAGTIKDTIPRYQTMKGNTVRRVWGWDCHGLPLENIVEKKYNLKHKKDIEAFGIDKFNEAARAAVFEYEAEWKKVIPRMGRFVDMDHPYKTMDSSYTESIWWSFKTLFDKGLIYEGSKIMHICPRCETTLAQSEVNMPGSYRDVTDISVTAQFKLTQEENTYVLAWTTTPWTLPGNTALAVNRDVIYAKVQRIDDANSPLYILAKSKIAEVFADTEVHIVEEFTGEKLIGLSYIPPFDYFKDIEMKNKDNIHRIWHADFITEEAGTGIAHEAPAFGAEDYALARTHNIPLIQHIALDGTFTKEVTDFFGMKVKIAGDTQSADIEIIKWLAKNGTLFSKKKIIHSYPHCWRCDTPLLNYATSSWFMDITQIKSKLLSENQTIGWVPEHTRDGRFGKWLEGAHDWALSRSRYWGAPLPVWKCSDCQRVDVFGSMADLQTKLVAQNTYSAMRHGQCIGNVSDLADSKGDPENHLTKQGVQEVTDAASKLSVGDFDLIIHSPLPRALETAHIVAEQIGISSAECISDARLTEFNFGEANGSTFASFWEKLRVLHYDFDAHMEGSESYRELQGRLSELLFECEQKYSGKKILFVTHGAPMWMLVTLTKNYSDTQAREFRHSAKAESGAHYFIPNATIMSLDFKPYPYSSHGLDFHRPYIDDITYTCHNTDCKGIATRIPDVFDCWYESGSMPFAQLHYPFEHKETFKKHFPADFIAEGLDQTRGWFYSLLNMSVGLFETTPYKHVIVNGLTMAADGQKMSKSKSNYTDPMVLVEKYGADSLRFALINSPLVRGENTLFPDSLVDEVSKKVVQKLENVYSFYQMYQSQDIAPSSSSQHVLDHWIRSRLYETIRSVTLGLDTYQLDSAARVFENFIDDLSTWFLRRSRDRMKSEDERERIQSIETLGYVLAELSKCLAPFMPFLAERIYQGISTTGKRESVHLESWPLGGHIDEIAISNMATTRSIASLGLEARNRAGIKVRQPLQTLSVPSLAGMSESHIQILCDELNVKSIVENTALVGGVELDTDITPELKQEGDMRELTRAIKDMRKDHGLSQGDSAVLLVQTDTLGQEFFQSIQIELQKTCGLSTVTVSVGTEKNTDAKEVSIGDLQFSLILNHHTRDK
ncbi:MAG: hypothetical protein RI996_158 [Candidatus Parcubacteria bacterium]|jgi:isoleucyl-tRNA synthetase